MSLIQMNMLSYVYWSLYALKFEIIAQICCSFKILILYLFLAAFYITY